MLFTFEFSSITFITSQTLDKGSHLKFSDPAMITVCKEIIVRYDLIRACASHTSNCTTGKWIYCLTKWSVNACVQLIFLSTFAIIKGSYINFMIPLDWVLRNSLLVAHKYINIYVLSLVLNTTEIQKCAYANKWM